MPTGRDLPTRPEPRQRQREGHADATRQQPVDPFPEKDHLIGRERHPRRTIDQNELRRPAIGVELGLPIGGRQRGEDARHRLPLGDRDAGFGEPGNATDHDDRHNHRRDAEQPPCQTYGVCRSSAIARTVRDASLREGLVPRRHVVDWNLAGKHYRTLFAVDTYGHNRGFIDGAPAKPSARRADARLRGAFDLDQLVHPARHLRKREAVTLGGR